MKNAVLLGDYLRQHCLKTLIPKVFCLGTLLFAPLGALAYEASIAHAHYVNWKGVLPAPYLTYSLEIQLNTDTDDVESMALSMGSRSIQFEPKLLSRLKNVELGTLDISHEIFRNEPGDVQPSENWMDDYFYITVEAGKRYRVEYCEEGKQRYLWGRDRLVVTVVDSERVEVSTQPLGYLERSIGPCADSTDEQR